MRRSDLPYLAVLGLFLAALFVGVGIDSETHTTYINGSRVQSPELVAVGNLTVGNTTNASANAVTRIYANGTVQRTNTSTGAVLPLNFTSNLTFTASNLTIHPNGTIANAQMVGCSGCIEVNASKVTTGSYVGNDTVNRAVAHGMGRAPLAVYMVEDSGTNGLLFILDGYGGGKLYNTKTPSNYAVTVPDATNFYVGNAGSYVLSGNANGQTLYWTAIG